MPITLPIVGLWQHVTELALATLDDATKKRYNNICVALPKVARASKEADMQMQYQRHFSQQMLPMYCTL
jgi:hypothetical protein